MRHPEENQLGSTAPAFAIEEVGDRERNVEFWRHASRADRHRQRTVSIVGAMLSITELHNAGSDTSAAVYGRVEAIDFERRCQYRRGSG